MARSVDGAVEAREANVEAEFSRVEFMNALGAEGWELVSETVDEVWVGAERRGITGGVSTPVRTCWTFKRPRE
ncbi:hypothetical protein [Miltoncostaea oceani]|uniref:hypothetical protein n=1 Tax=Miltoncostaea oceani TaxID=2843216 RepID=UPI001C3E0929|nr:hypothetical protein [Miltoncostaea oceani]